MGELVVWSKEGVVTINVKKTMTMWSHSPTQDGDMTGYEIKIDGIPLKNVDCYNYLGIMVDRYLAFDKQAEKQIGIISSKVQHLRRLARTVGEPHRIEIYKHMIAPYFDYCHFVIECMSPTNIKRMQTLQNDALRVCCGVRRATDVSTDELHERCGVERLASKRKRLLLSLMYKASRDEDNTVTPVRDLRSSTCIQLKRVDGLKPIFDKSPWYRGRILWNTLPPKTQHSKSLDIFKEEVKKLAPLLNTHT